MKKWESVEKEILTGADDNLKSRMLKLDLDVELVKASSIENEIWSGTEWRHYTFDVWKLHHEMNQKVVRHCFLLTVLKFTIFRYLEWWSMTSLHLTSRFKKFDDVGL